MKSITLILAAGLLTTSPLLALAQDAADKNHRSLETELTGYQEVPSISTPGEGEFSARINNGATSLTYELAYADLSSNVTQAHIHFAQPGVNGGVAVWLCSNLASPPTPAGVPPCPPAPAVVSGVIDASDVVGPSAQGIAPRELAELLAAIRAGTAYVNVHTSTYPGGEVRGQLGGRGRGN